MTDEPMISVANEFAHVEVTKVHTRNGERLAIRAPRRGFEILLDAVLLEALAWSRTTDLTDLLRTPNGPGT
ncbi:hypothetical protein ACFQ08_02670 [Streptosporangium algeriense]|uniref:Dihydrodiol dehydrogenase n=1 Tax=Streptosporangium algeriense TaxID=1682748 RepID=A0ABW3DL21_9ACTN